MVQNSQQNQKPAHTEYPNRISTLFRSHPSKCYTKREWFVLSSVFGIRSVGETSRLHSLTLLVRFSLYAIAWLRQSAADPVQ